MVSTARKEAISTVAEDGGQLQLAKELLWLNGSEYGFGFPTDPSKSPIPTDPSKR